jgi:hypothetical protein
MAMSENGDNRDSPIHGNQTIGKMIINEWIGLWLCGYASQSLHPPRETWEHMENSLRFFSSSI